MDLMTYAYNHKILTQKQIYGKGSWKRAHVKYSLTKNIQLC